MPNPFRLRRLINRDRPYPITFAQLEHALKALEPFVPNWGRGTERNYDFLVKSFEETMENLDSLEREFLDQVRSFYQTNVGWDTAAQVQGLQIQDRYSKPGQRPKYRVQITISGEKGRLIGRGGAHVNSLRNSLNLEVDLD